jgi:hypothetical protein
MHVPAGATLDIRIQLTATANITSFVARQKVTQYVIQEISSQLGAGEPDLVVGERLRWSVPVVFTLPGKGVIGRVGEILVDATTGEVLTEADTVARISDHVRQLTQRAALQAPFLPQVALSKD